MHNPRLVSRRVSHGATHAIRGPRWLTHAAAALVLFCVAPLVARAEDGEIVRETLRLAPDQPYQWPAERPEANDVLERHVQAIGGRDKVFAPKTLNMAGSRTAEATRTRSGVRVWQSAPDRLKLEFREPGVGTQTIYYDGSVAWAESDGTRYALIEGAMLRDVKAAAGFYGEADYEKRYSSLESYDFARVVGVPCVRLKFKMPSGKSGFLAFSLTSGRHLATQTVLGANGAEIDEIDPSELDRAQLSVVTVAEYIDVKGVLVPRVTLQETPTGRYITEFRTVEHDGEPADFSRPKAVDALIEQRDAAAD